MKKATTKSRTKTRLRTMTRGEFVGTVTAAGVVAGAPAFLRG